MTSARTLFDKVWDEHVVWSEPGRPDLIYIDLHLLNEQTSPQAFSGLRLNGRRVRRPDLTLGAPDHIPTLSDDTRWNDVMANVMRDNGREFGFQLYDVRDARLGIVHVISPEQGLTQPGMTIVCGDSHTCTNGAFGAIAHGIGTSEVEHVLTTQTLWQKRPHKMAVEVSGRLHENVTAKDVIISVIRQIGFRGGVGYTIEYRGDVIRDLSMEGRMTVCNMTIEAGAKVGMIAPDDKTYAYMEGRNFAPKGKEWERALERWQRLTTDRDAKFDTEVVIDGQQIEPSVTWGTLPEQSLPVTGRIPAPEESSNPQAVMHALKYMDLRPGMAIQDITLDKVFIGSCTNGRIEDLRAAARIVRGYDVAKTVSAVVVPGSGLVKMQAEKEGLDRIFRAAGFEWREPGCSMCVGLNPPIDIVQPGERCASTSSRNFEGRQGPGARTHLVSPVMAAAAAVAGHFVDVREWPVKE
jgi:3-isopropylmalate/(R)-2-methylmalate dehydratase large subunit